MKHTEDLASTLKAAMNKEFRDYKVAYFLDDEEYSPAHITGFISTGSSILDLVISNRPNGGIALGRITEINGLPSTGKSLVGAHILAEVQKMGGQAVFIDTENAVSSEFLKAIGVDISKMLYCPVETLEDVYRFLESIIVKIREADPNGPVAILIDTISGISTAAELAGDYEKEGWATDKAIINSKAMRKLTQLIGREKIAVVFTTQLRANLGAGFGEKYTTSGGYALPYHASTRIRLSNLGQIKDSAKNVIGMKTRCKIIKNRIGPPLRTADFYLYFESGIRDKISWLDTLKGYKEITTKGSWHILINKETGEEIKFQGSQWEDMLKDDTLRKYVYKILCDNLILKYKEPPSIDEISIDKIPADEL